MRRSVWTEDGLDVVDEEPGPLESGWARLRVDACGICGSDLHFWHRELPVQIGSTPGHEMVGTLIDGPAGLPDVRYAISPNISCGVCEYCRSGRSNLCGKAGVGLGLGRNGGLAEYVDAPIANLAAIPDGVDPVTASLTEPLAVVVRGVSLARIEPDSRVLVIGAGTIGLSAALLARDRAAEVAIGARHPHQRAAAEAIGVTVLGEDEVAPWGREHRPDVVIESVGGSGGTLDTALRVVGRGGRVLLLGDFSEPKSLDLHRFMMKEVSLIGSFAYGEGDRESQFAMAARLTGRFTDDLAALTTHQFGLDQVTHAFRTAGDKSTGAIKVTITP